ncbi:hypothetical protein [Thiobacillus sp.]
MNMESIAETSPVLVARNLAKTYREGEGTVQAWRGIDTPRSGHVGFVFQFYHLIPGLPAREGVA